jgi:hypothetical protein
MISSAAIIPRSRVSISVACKNLCKAEPCVWRTLPEGAAMVVFAISWILPLFLVVQGSGHRRSAATMFAAALVTGPY